MKRTLRLTTELVAEIALLDLVLPDDRGRGAHAPVELLEHVVVDQREADVLVPARLAAPRVNLPQQVEGSTRTGVGKGERGRLGLGSDGLRGLDGPCGNGGTGRALVLGRRLGRWGHGSAQQQRGAGSK